MIVHSQSMLLLLSTILTAAILLLSGVDFTSLADSYQWGPSLSVVTAAAHTGDGLFQRVVTGILAVIPMLLLSYQVERSTERNCIHVNLSTTLMSMTLFGRRLDKTSMGLSQRAAAAHRRNGDDDDWRDDDASRTGVAADTSNRPEELDVPSTTWPYALLLSILLACVTAYSEEIVFRVQIPSLVRHFTPSSWSSLVGLFLQATIFGLGHLSPQAKPGENRAVSAIQFTNGLWHGFIYLLSGGDIVPCIIAHALYDMDVFFHTWMVTNDQIDYADTKYLDGLTNDERKDIRLIQRQVGGVDTVPEFVYAACTRLYHNFDSERVGTLSRNDLRRGMTYMFLNEQVMPSQEDVDFVFDMCTIRRKELGPEPEEDDRMSLGDFIRGYLFLKERVTVSSSSLVSSSQKKENGGWEKGSLKAGTV